MDTQETTDHRLAMIVGFFTLVAIMVTLGGNFALTLQSTSRNDFAARNLFVAAFIAAAAAALYCWTELKAMEREQSDEVTLVLVTVEPAQPVKTVGVHFAVTNDGDIVIGSPWAPDPATVGWVDPSLN